MALPMGRSRRWPETRPGEIPKPPTPCGVMPRPAQAALRFVLANRDFATRVIGITEIAQLDAAIEAVARGPLSAAAMSGLEALWANGFGA